MFTHEGFTSSCTFFLDDEAFAVAPGLTLVLGFAGSLEPAVLSVAEVS